MAPAILPRKILASTLSLASELARVLIAALVFFIYIGDTCAIEHIVNGGFEDDNDLVQTAWTTTSNPYRFEDGAYRESSVEEPGYLTQTVVAAVGPAALSFDFESTAGYQLTLWHGILIHTIIGESALQHHSF